MHLTISQFKLTLLRWGYALLAISRIYSIWSKLHRVLFDRAARKVQLPTFKNVEEIVPYVRGMVWRPDGPKDLWDAICTPEMVWLRYLTEQNHRVVGDCDEHAVFWSNVIQKSIETGVWQSRIEDPDFLSISWTDHDGKSSGHNVCLLKLGDIYGYVDYDLPIWCGATIEDVVMSVLRSYGGINLIGWTVMSPTLKLREFFIP